MTRHAKNCTAGTVYTYHERKKDTATSGYGSKSIRVGKDSVKDFDCCSLTLQPCRNPVITPDGHLYDKEAILEYIIHKKKEIALKLKKYEKQKSKNEAEQLEIGQAEAESQKKAFMENEANPVKMINNSTEEASTSGSTSISNMKQGKDKALPSFWLPCLTPSASASVMTKPDEKVRCPMSGKPIKLKDLIDITFTPINDRDTKTSLITKQARYVCAVSNDVLGNSVPCVALKTSGKVVTMECVEKIIKKDMIDPINGKKLTDKDIIRLQRGASGFSASGIQLDAKEIRPSMQA
ncbi:nitric oxide synthase-interacting protein isoform X1 [Octopus sinensis]|nr:nitric oxide synthase-interacting protein isoform X1 [Octopus sinensis]